MDYIHLYTRQHENSIYELEQKGRITNKEIYIKLHMRDIAPFFLEKYSTFTQMAQKRLPRPKDVNYPIWCSVSKENCLRPIEKELVYALRVPKKELIYFDGGKWDFVLNNLYLPKNKEDEAAYLRELKKYGINNSFELLLDKNKGIYLIFEKRIKESWERIFDIDDWNPFIVQANLWQIKEEWVKHILGPGEDLFALEDMEETFPPKDLIF
ncbi:MAG TPA: DUF3841 domain-containing protein [Clostridia bacterium]|nr:DUF3841 domain-containing protein [Clostridia bacterium]